MQQPVIEVVSDVVCPWCFIGKRRPEKALALLDRPKVGVRWKPNPDAPKEGMDRQAYRARKFGSLARAEELEARVAAASAEEGIQFRFDLIQKIPNTFERTGSSGSRAERAYRMPWWRGSSALTSSMRRMSARLRC
jgi:predicted DsbA family dithiol-disulfide isomerase